jgi:hypothetical protein
MPKEEELGKVKISDSVSIIVRRANFRGKWYIDIRKKVDTEKYTGFTAKGIFIPVEKFFDVLEILKKVKI